MGRESDWGAFYEATEDGEPRESFLAGLDAVPADLPKEAIDVGFGAGNETRALLRRGWAVTAIDAEPAAAEILRERVGDHPDLRIVTASFAAATYPTASFVYAGYSLPFGDPGSFDAVWAQITDALRPGGVFCGQLFGDRDEWADRADMTVHTRSAVDALLEELAVVELEEVEGRMGTATGEEKYWHYYDVIARKPSAD
ncbi:MAG: class I SAM-dependent methyltransferase [Halobacteriales archaeon]|nr:class I SAM-dependent methyltransferase [Halobacteriales archaeon]